MAKKGGQPKFSLSATEISAPGADAAWIPDAFRDVARELVADNPYLGITVSGLEFHLAKTLAERKLDAPVQTGAAPRIVASKRIIASLRDGGTDQCLAIGWFDPGGDVHRVEFPGLWRAQGWSPSTDGKHLAFLTREGLEEGDLVDGKRQVIWPPDPRALSLSHDYVDPDHILLCIDLKSTVAGEPGGGEARLLERRPTGVWATVASDTDAKCEHVTVIPPFAMLFAAKSRKKVKVIAARGSDLITLGKGTFKVGPKDLAIWDREITFSDAGVAYRVDGLWDAYERG